MNFNWLRRAAAVARKRTRLAFVIASGRPLSGPERRLRLILSGRREGGGGLTARVVELPPNGSGRREPFATPSVLLLQLAHIGDFVLSLRAVEKIRDGFPGSKVTLVCASWNVAWARQSGLFDEIVAFDFFPHLNSDWRGPAPGAFDRFAALPLGRFDIAVDLRHDGDTRPCLYRIDARARAGFAAPLERGLPGLDLMLPKVELVALSDGREFSLHAELRLALLADAVVTAYAEPGPHPISRIVGSVASPAGRRTAFLALSAGDPIRRWPSADFIQLGRGLIETHDLDVVVAGGAPERALVAEIVAGLPPGRAAGCVDLSLGELAARVAGATVFVGLGSGVTHLAAKLGTPTVCLLSGVSPLDVWRPSGPRVVNLTGQTPCSPCGLKREEDCPFDVTCLRAIKPRHALAAVEKLLGAERANPGARANLAPGLAARP